MLVFNVDQQKCITCGECVADCPARIIAMAAGNPFIAPEKEAGCYRCQHCFTVCPTGAVVPLVCGAGNTALVLI